MERYINRTIQGDIVIEAALVDGDKVTPIDLVKEGIKTVDDLNRSPIVIEHITPTPEEIEAITNEKVGDYVDRLIAFCKGFVRDMMIENIRLGIGKADTKTVQAITDLTAAALKSVENGSLRVAIEQIAAIPADQLDGHFLTEARLTAKRNEIEAFLGIPPALTYNE